MAKCPNCGEEINALAHGINCCLIFKAELDDKGKLDPGFEPGKPLTPIEFDSLSEWYSCAFCAGSIIDETKVNDKLSTNEIDKAAEKFLKGEDYECPEQG